MRNMKWIIFSLSAVFVFGCIDNTGDSHDIEREKERIMEVIIAETEYFISRDIDALAHVYVSEDYTRTIHDIDQDPGVVRCSNRYDNIIKGFESYFNSTDDVKYIPPSRSDLDIQIRGDIAWVYFKEDHDDPHHNVRILERINGDWKIALVSVHVESVRITTN